MIPNHRPKSIHIQICLSVDEAYRLANCSQQIQLGFALVDGRARPYHPHPQRIADRGPRSARLPLVCPVHEGAGRRSHYCSKDSQG